MIIDKHIHYLLKKVYEKLTWHGQVIGTIHCGSRAGGMDGPQSLMHPQTAQGQTARPQHHLLLHLTSTGAENKCMKT